MVLIVFQKLRVVQLLGWSLFKVRRSFLRGFEPTLMQFCIFLSFFEVFT